MTKGLKQQQLTGKTRLERQKNKRTSSHSSDHAWCPAVPSIIPSNNVPLSSRLMLKSTLPTLTPTPGLSSPFLSLNFSGRYVQYAFGRVEGHGVKKKVSHDTMQVFVSAGVCKCRLGEWQRLQRARGVTASFWGRRGYNQLSP